MTVRLSKEEKDLIRKAGSILRECLQALSGEIKEGVSTKELERKTDDFISSRPERGEMGHPADGRNRWSCLSSLRDKRRT